MIIVLVQGLAAAQQGLDAVTLYACEWPKARFYDRKYNTRSQII